MQDAALWDHPAPALRIDRCDTASAIERHLKTMGEDRQRARAEADRQIERRESDLRTIIDALGRAGVPVINDDRRDLLPRILEAIGRIGGEP